MNMGKKLNKKKKIIMTISFKRFCITFSTIFYRNQFPRLRVYNVGYQLIENPKNKYIKESFTRNLIEKEQK